MFQNPPQKEFYAVKAFTGDSRRFPTHTKVKIQLIGEKGATQFLPIKTPNNFSCLNLFQKNRGDIFYILGENVGALRQINIRLEGAMRNWLMQKIEIVHRGHIFITSEHNVSIFNKATFNLLYKGDRWNKFLDGRIALGPLLKFRGTEKKVTTLSDSNPTSMEGSTDDSQENSTKNSKVSTYYKLSIAITTENVKEITTPLKFHSTLQSHIGECLPEMYFQYGEFKLWRFDFEFELHEKSQLCNYTMPNGMEGTFLIPGINEKPRVMFGSCLDREHPYRLTFMENRTVSWLYLREEHEKDPYHMMVLGGDQVYADQVFICTREFMKWDLRRNRKKKLQEEFTRSMELDAEVFYFFLYIFSWNEGNIPEMMSKIPTVMMWDDHDIFDGWGSLQPEYLHSKVLQGLFPIAKEAFFIHQLSGDLYPVFNKKDRNGPFNTVFNTTGNTSFLLLDTRSERNMIDHKHGIIHSEESWIAIEKWFSSDEATKNDHIFVIATTPLVYPHRKATDFIMDKTNSESIDDSRDHWPAPIHKEELDRLLANMTKFLRSSPNKSVTALSGDVHVGALGSIRNAETDEILIDQLIASGMGSVPPPNIALWAFKHILHMHFELKNNINTRMEKLPDRKYFLETQNFLSLSPIYGRPKPTYLAKWLGVPDHKNIKIGDKQPLPTPIEMSIETH